jgi:uncharacterized protein (UPF0548 family)
VFAFTLSEFDGPLPAVTVCAVRFPYRSYVQDSARCGVTCHPSTRCRRQRGFCSRSPQRPDDGANGDTGSMFRLSRTSEGEKQELLAIASNAPVSSPHLLTLAEGLLDPKPPTGFAHDLSRSNIGQGQQTFETARDAFLRWQQFDLGWVQVLNSSAEIIPGQLIGVEAHTAYLWSVNFNRIVETVDNSHRFGFMYATTALHVEQGQERFVLEFDPLTGVVSYLIEAVSRPRHPLARLAYPFSRAMQHRFARDSHTRIRSCILGS